MKNRKILTLALCIIFTGGVFSLLWAKPVEVGDVSNRGTMPAYSPKLGVSIPSVQKPEEVNIQTSGLLPALNQEQGNGVIEVGDTIVADRNVILYTRNDNPIDNFGGSYVYQGEVEAGTDMVVLDIDNNIAISRFELPEGADGHIPVLAMDCVQYKVQLPDGRIGYLVEYSDSFIGNLARFIFGGAHISEAQ